METIHTNLLENISSQMRKGILEFAILLAISKKEIYASEIIDLLREAKLTVVEGTIYPLLSRLKKGELLDYCWQESETGPPRKYYSLTEKGKVFLKECEKEWSTLEKAINNLKK